jgi:catechol 2,3-dioxygenase-like lactoylglutathione lyase family enzyme
MLQGHEIHPTIPATDLQRARAFYADKLGLTPAFEDPGGLVYETAIGSWFRLFPTPYAGTAQHTVAGWAVDNLEAEVAELKAKGVVFLEYDTPGIKTVDGIATMPGGLGAWLKTVRATSSVSPRRCHGPQGTNPPEEAPSTASNATVTSRTPAAQARSAVAGSVIHSHTPTCG